MTITLEKFKAILSLVLLLTVISVARAEDPSHEENPKAPNMKHWPLNFRHEYPLGNPMGSCAGITETQKAWEKSCAADRFCGLLTLNQAADNVIRICNGEKCPLPRKVLLPDGEIVSLFEARQKIAGRAQVRGRQILDDKTADEFYKDGFKSDLAFREAIESENQKSPGVPEGQLTIVGERDKAGKYTFIHQILTKVVDGKFYVWDPNNHPCDPSTEATWQRAKVDVGADGYMSLSWQTMRRNKIETITCDRVKLRGNRYLANEKTTVPKFQGLNGRVIIDEKTP